MQKQYTRHIANTISLDERITSEPAKTLDDEQKNDYTAFDSLISKMHLTAVEYETLSILMAGFTMLQIGQILNSTKTVKSRLFDLQCYKSDKYLTSTEQQSGADKTAYAKNTCKPLQ